MPESQTQAEEEPITLMTVKPIERRLLERTQARTDEAQSKEDGMRVTTEGDQASRNREANG